MNNRTNLSDLAKPYGLDDVQHRSTPYWQGTALVIVTHRGPCGEIF